MLDDLHKKQMPNSVLTIGSLKEVNMINLEVDEEIDKMQSNLKNMAISMFRPISRKYDEAEHEYPVELDMFRKFPVLSRPKKRCDLYH